MPQYSRPEIDLSTRLALVIEMLTPFPIRPWGRVTELARTYGISRSLLYQMRDRAYQGMGAALAPRCPGPPPQTQRVVIDRDFLQRAIPILALLKGTVRDLQQGLDLLFGVHRSVGYISQVLQRGGRAAAEYHRGLPVPRPVLGEADEIFQGRHPCLTVVDGRSFLVLYLSPADRRDATTWGVTLLDLEARGVRFQDLALDGATGLRAGVQEAEIRVPLRPDLFHLLREAFRLGQQLERAAYRALQVAERARRAEQEAQAPTRRRGPRLKVTVGRTEAEEQEQQAMAVYDLYTWLLEEVRQGLEPISPEGRLTTAAQARGTMETAVELLQALGHPRVSTLARKLLDHTEELVAPLAWLEQSLADWRPGLEADTETFIGWAWRHREALAVDVARDFPASLQPVVQAFWQALSLFHRSSSLAESFHSWLRPYLQIHRGMPAWLMPLLQVWWNHHPFQRGKRAGQCPLELAGVQEVLDLSDLLDRLLSPGAITEWGVNS